MKLHLVVLLLVALSTIAAPAEKKFAIVRPGFAQSEDGPMVAASYQFVPGESIFFSCQVDGYKKSEKDEIYLTYLVEAKDAHGVLLQAAANGKIQATLSDEDKNWMPKVRETIVVPPLADPGEYQLNVKVKDELGGASAEARTTFSVHGRLVAPSDTLVVRDFHFFRTEDETKPLQVAAYRPGDAVWGRFDMTGYKLGDGNQFDIEYGITVLGADGSVAYSEPHAAAQKEQTFYPQRYQPGVLSLNLAKDQKRGEYTIVLTVRDNLGKQTWETREKFAVE
jgi:hypothetical protein